MPHEGKVGVGGRWLAEPLIAAAIAVAALLAWSAIYAARLPSQGVEPAQPMGSPGEWVLRVLAPLIVAVALWAGLTSAANWFFRRSRRFVRVLSGGAVALALVLPVAVRQMWLLFDQDGWRGLGAAGALQLAVVPVAAMFLSGLASLIFPAFDRRPR